MQLTEKHIQEILNLYNYFNMAIITDEKGVVEYFYNNRPDINSMTEQDVLGHYLLESCVSLTEETSTILYTLRTGKAIHNQFQEFRNANGDVIYNYCSTVPIKDGNQVIGAVEVARYIESKTDFKCEEKEISLFVPCKIKNKRHLYTCKDIIGSSKEMQRLKYKIECVANTDSTVLIYGETGTGKELVAESIHSMGKRKGKKFVSQNCAAIPPTLLEAILFGTEKGSFTGAETKKGLLEVASGGTLFLDEINTMDFNTQSKLLKAIEEKQITRVGGIRPIPVDVRIISAVNIQPQLCLKKEILREDLYYRLRVVELKLPPLRQRKEDIPELTRLFIRYFNHKMGKYIEDISEEVRRYFMTYDWPGNVRELKNTIEGGFNMAVTPIIEMQDLCLGNELNDNMKSLEKDINGNRVSLKDLLREKEWNVISTVMKESDNITQAAKKLGISRQFLAKKIKEYQK